MKRLFLSLMIFVIICLTISAESPLRVMVITGGHGYNKEEFDNMLSSIDPAGISFQISELPAAYDLFLPENRNKYDVLVFYHMWQTITDDQKRVFAECIREGKPVVALHHSICAYDDWPEYWDIIGGKYFHKTTVLNGKEYLPCTYIHDLRFKVRNASPRHPVTQGIPDFEIFDETYKGYYIEEGVTPLLETDEPSSTPVIGWATEYGKAKVVVLQSGHDVPTFQNQYFRKLLRQSIEWVHN